MESLFDWMAVAAVAAAGLIVLGAILLKVYPSLRNKMNGLLMRAAATVAAGLYAISPIDVIPDFIPVLGQLDDIGVLVLLMLYWLSLPKQAGAPVTARRTSDQVIDIKPVE